MSRPDRVVGVKSSRASTAPYPGAARPAAAATSASSGPSGAPAPSTALPRLTVHNFPTFQTRVKKLPPDANVSAATHVRLYQLPERVCFGCAKCRRDNIQSDSVAVDVRNKVILCTHCFTRIIRPRQYRPSRVVPFPSLLSWLHYTPAAAATHVSEDVLERPAEAVAPSGERRAAPLHDRGDRPSAIARLPNSAMNIVPTPGAGGRGGGGGGRGGRGRGAGAAGASSGDGAHKGSTSSGKHPCLRVWGVCVHGDLCAFREAPAELCLAYLMGLCGGPHAEAAAATAAPAHGPRSGRRHRRGGGGGGGGASTDEHGRAIPAPAARRPCRLAHQDVFDLPNPMARSTLPAVRYPGDIDTSAAAVDDEDTMADEEDEAVAAHFKALRENRLLWQRWLDKRINSPNSAEWQLWNNGPIRPLFDQYVPASHRPAAPRALVEKPQEAETAEAETEETSEAPVAEAEPKMKLNLADIQSALRGLQQ